MLRDAGVQTLVRRDEAAVERDAVLLVAEVGGVRAAADGDEEQVRLDLLAVLQADRHRVRALLDAGELRAGLEGDLALAELALERLGEELVLVGHEVRQGLDDRDLAAEALPHAGELDADDAAAEHDDALGHVVEVDGLGGGEHPAAELEAGQRLRVRAGGQDDVPALVALPVDLDGVLPDELARRPRSA